MERLHLTSYLKLICTAFIIVVSCDYLVAQQSNCEELEQLFQDAENLEDPSIALSRYKAVHQRLAKGSLDCPELFYLTIRRIVEGSMEDSVDVALTHCKKCIDEFERSRDRDHAVDYLRCIRNAARAYELGYNDLIKAYTLGKKAYEGAVELLGTNHFITHILAGDFGRTNNSLGNYPETIDLIGELLTGDETNFRATDLATLYNTLAEAYGSLGNNENARHYFKETLKHLDPDSEDYLFNLMNYGIELKNCDLLDSAISVLEFVRGHVSEDSGLDFYKLQYNLSNAYIRGGRHNQADSLLGVLINYYTHEDPISESFAKVLFTAGSYRESQSEFKAAQNLFQKALEIRLKIFRYDHLHVIQTELSIAHNYWLQGYDERAKEIYQRVIPGILETYRNYITRLSEHGRISVLKSFNPYFDNFYSFAFRSVSGPVEPAIDLHLNMKNRILEISRDNLAAYIESDEENELFTAWKLTRSLLNREYMNSGPGKKVDSLALICDQLEETILRESRQKTNTGADIQDINYKSVQNSLKTRDLALGIIHFENGGDMQEGDVNYYGYLVQKNREPAIFSMENESVIDSILSNGSDLDRNYQLLSLRLGQIIKPYLRGRDHLYISPSGIYNKISFGGIVIEQPSGNNHLMDLVDLTYVGSLRDILSREGRSGQKKVLIAGGLDYGATPQGADMFRHLDGSTIEAEEISKLFTEGGWTIMQHNHSAFSKQDLLDIESPVAILHLATHGYGRESVPESCSFSNPLFDYGLALSGANDGPMGRINAYEISGLNLPRTELVVLSSCESGLGANFRNEGVFGLQRAFFNAGVKNVIVSLWKVPDKQTRELMTIFYRNYLSGDRLPKAFRSAQLEIRDKYPEMVNWASFILISSGLTDKGRSPMMIVVVSLITGLSFFLVFKFFNFLQK